MEKKVIEQFESTIYLCDICNKHVIQDGKDISLLKTHGAKNYAYHMHTSCLIDHLKKTFIPNF